MDSDFSGVVAELVEQFTTEDGVDMVGLADWFLSLLTAEEELTVQQWEDFRIVILNVCLVFDNLIEQRKAAITS